MLLMSIEKCYGILDDCYGSRVLCVNGKRKPKVFRNPTAGQKRVNRTEPKNGI